MYPWISKNIFYLPIGILRGEPVRRCLREIEDFERLSRDEMAAKQWDQLKVLIEFAYRNNPYYRDLFKKACIVPEEIATLADFERVPFLTKRLLKKNFNSMLSESSGRISLRKTSGSTGMPLKLAKDRIASAYMDAYMYHFYSWYGITMGSRQARIWGIPFSLSGRIMTRAKDLLLNRRRLVTFEMSLVNCCNYYKRLKAFHPYYAYGLITPIQLFARLLTENGINPRELGLSVIISTGERLHPARKIYVESAFNCRVVNEYGCTESGIIAFECPSGNLHVANHNLLVEIVDPKTGKASAVGETGEVVITELFATGMPLIRYRLGDMACRKAELCECGRHSPLIGDIVGRTSELIPTPDGRMVAAAILDYAMPSYVTRFRAVLTEVDRLVILLECPHPLTAQEERSIQSKLGQYLGKQMRIELRTMDSIPSDPSGKLRCFISELTKKELT